MKIRTVTGDVPAEKIGRTLTHEHLLYTYPGGEYDHQSSFDLDDAVARISSELRAGMDGYGYATLVDMTPCEVGRHPELMKRVAQKTGAHIIAVTGFFPERMGVPYWFRRQSVEELTEFYLRDLTEGMGFGGNVQVDHIGIPWRHDSSEGLDESMANMVCKLAERGYLGQMTITFDRWFFNPRGAATAENPQLLNEKVGLGHLFDSFAPRLAKKGFGAPELDKLLVDNPKRILPLIQFRGPQALLRAGRRETQIGLAQG